MRVTGVARRANSTAVGDVQANRSAKPLQDVATADGPIRTPIHEYAGAGATRPVTGTMIAPGVRVQGEPKPKGWIPAEQWAQMSPNARAILVRVRKSPNVWVSSEMWAALAPNERAAIQHARKQGAHHGPKTRRRKPHHDNRQAQHAQPTQRPPKTKTVPPLGSPVPALDASLLQGKSNEQLLDVVRSHAYPSTNISYNSARMAMFTDVDNVAGRVRCVYTSKLYETKGIPDATRMNTEHTWPRSKKVGGRRAESDMHHLFPTNSKANESRSNYPFGVVVKTLWTDGESKLGTDSRGHTVFEPRDDHKGNVARAMFYISSVYALEIPDDEEAVLKHWHAADPTDPAERERNERIGQYQGNRNPFIDYPELVFQVEDF